MCRSLFASFAITMLIGIILLSAPVSADNDGVVDSIELTVPVACTMSGIGANSHNASINSGTYSGASGSEFENGIGKTTLTTFCNDNNGFSIYAIGFTGDQYEGANHTKLVGQNTNQTISTKVYQSGDTDSNWSIKLTKVENPASGSPITYNPQNMTIQNSFNNWHAVPDTYTKVAEYYSGTTNPSTTDTILGAKLETTYAAYISNTQPADTYTGQVKYTMVHPYTEEPLQPRATSSGQICYYANANNVEGTMGCQTIGTSDNTTSTSAMLLAGNFSRTGYGFAGWSEKFDYETNTEAHFYGPQEDIGFEEGQYSGDNPGLSLYAVWVKSAGSLQDSSKITELCGTSPSTGTLVTTPTNGTANLSSVTALTDQRDNQTYAIARLADGKCWMIENLRLESTNSDNSTGTLSQSYGKSSTYGNFAGLADAEDTGFSATYSANTLYSNDGSNNTVNIGTSNSPGVRMPRYNNLNTQSRPSNPTSNVFASNNTDGGMYSYGNYYTWHAAIADLTYYSTSNTSVTGSSLCPSGWHLPKGGNKSNESNNEYWLPIVNIIGATPANYGSSTTPYYTGSEEGLNATNAVKAFPYNLIYSGYFSNSSAYTRGTYGDYWTATARNASYANFMTLGGNSVYPGDRALSKANGYTIRCVADS